MTFNEFQDHCIKTAVYPNVGNNLPYTVLGLCGEAGEVAEKVKKMLRDDNGVLNLDRRQAIKMELADVMWYVATTAMECAITLESVIEEGLKKYKSRQERGVLHGDGDNR